MDLQRQAANGMPRKDSCRAIVGKAPDQSHHLGYKPLPGADLSLLRARGRRPAAGPAGLRRHGKLDVRHRATQPVKRMLLKSIHPRWRSILLR